MRMGEQAPVNQIQLCAAQCLGLIRITRTQVTVKLDH